MPTETEMEEFKAELLRHYLPLYEAAREIGISHAECLEIKKLKLKIDINKESTCRY